MFSKASMIAVASGAVAALSFAQQPRQNPVSMTAGVSGVSHAIAVTSLAASGDYEFVGSKKCKKCHIKQYKSWAKTKHGSAFDILMPGNSSEAKTKAGVDVAKDFTADAKCIKCHTVGFGHAGGYETPDAGDKKAVRKAKKLQNVGCECCHGPGSAYVKVFGEIQKSKRQYSVDELYAVGLTKIDENTCKTCHNDESPSFTSFDFAEMKAKGLHENIPLKQRK